MSFYKELNRLSTADFYDQTKKKTRNKSSRDFFEIERVISRRKRLGNVSKHKDYFISYIAVLLGTNLFEEKALQCFIYLQLCLVRLSIS